MKKIWVFLLVCINCCLWANSEIGKVTNVQGSATATQPIEKERTLAVGSTIYVKDTLRTMEDATVQIEFIDKSILDLKPNTRFLIEEYKYGNALAKDRSYSELAEGGFRLLSGSIKPDPNQYNVKTPNATIGLMGTLLDAEMSDEALYVSCTKGRVQIKNAAGTVVIGEGMEQYAVVTSYARRPRIFISPPSNMIRPNIRPGVGPRH